MICRSDTYGMRIVEGCSMMHFLFCRLGVFKSLLQGAVGFMDVHNYFGLPAPLERLPTENSFSVDSGV